MEQEAGGQAGGAATETGADPRRPDRPGTMGTEATVTDMGGLPTGGRERSPAGGGRGQEGPGRGRRQQRPEARSLLGTREPPVLLLGVQRMRLRVG